MCRMTYLWCQQWWWVWVCMSVGVYGQTCWSVESVVWEDVNWRCCLLEEPAGLGPLLERLWGRGVQWKAFLYVCLWRRVVCVSTSRGVCTSRWTGTAGLSRSHTRVSGETEDLVPLLHRLCVLRPVTRMMWIAYMYTFPVNRPLSWLVQEWKRMRQLVLLVFVWMFSVSVCVDLCGCVYTCFVFTT